MLFNARSDEESALRGMFGNRWLWGAVALSATLQVCVVYTPFLQRAFSTASLSLADWCDVRRSRAQFCGCVRSRRPSHV
jgi:P-type Ca2+ transporter type 2C